MISNIAAFPHAAILSAAAIEKRRYSVTTSPGQVFMPPNSTTFV